MSRLATGNLALLVLLLAHTADHGLNQPERHVPALSGVIGGLGFAIVLAASVLALRRSRHAAAASLGSAAATAAGFVAVHLLPRWSGAVSDPFWAFDPNAISWALLTAPIIACVWLSAVAIAELRRDRLLAPVRATASGG